MQAGFARTGRWFASEHSGIVPDIITTAKGLGALFFQLHAPEASVSLALGIPGEHRLIGAIAIGYPLGEESGGSPSRRARRPFADVVHREGW